MGNTLRCCLGNRLYRIYVALLLWPFCPLMKCRRGQSLVWIYMGYYCDIMTQRCHSKDEIMMQSCGIHCIAGILDGGLNKVVWQSGLKPPN